jgi:hypothetical protein
MLCGMIIAGYEGEPLVHMIPANKLLNNIEASVGAPVTLCNDRKPHRPTNGDETLEISLAPPPKVISSPRPPVPDPLATRPRQGLYYEREYLDTLAVLSSRNLPPLSEMRQMPSPSLFESSAGVIKPSLGITKTPQTTTEASQGRSRTPPRVSEASPIARVTDTASLEGTERGLRGVRLAAIILTLSLMTFLVTMVRQHSLCS